MMHCSGKTTVLLLIIAVLAGSARAGFSQCESGGVVSIPFLSKPGEGWDVAFAKKAKPLKKGPYLLADGRDSGLGFIEYEAKKHVITLPHIEVDPCRHTGIIRDWHLLPKQVIGFEKNGHLFAYQVAVQMIAGPDANSQVIGSNTHVIFYDTHGDGIFDSVRLGAGVELPIIPEWVRGTPGAPR